MNSVSQAISEWPRSYSSCSAPFESQWSYIRNNIAESIGLQGHSDVISVATLRGETNVFKRFQRMQFTLSPIQGHPKEDVEMEALTLHKICNPYTRFAIPTNLPN